MIANETLISRNNIVNTNTILMQNIIIKDEANPYRLY